MVTGTACAAPETSKENRLFRADKEFHNSLDLFVGFFGSKAPEQLALNITQILTDSETLLLISELKRVKGLR